MFFILSKIFSYLLSPLLWIIILLFFAYFSKNRKKQKKHLIVAVILLLFFSDGIIYHFAKNSIAEKPIKYSDLQNTYDYGIVLGGFSGFDENTNRLVFHKETNRIMQALSLYKQKKIKKIFISGGYGNLFGKKYKEADYVKKFLIQTGIKPEDILTENKSRNTFENAKYTAQILKPENPKCLLITSSLHMFRAKKCFKKTGLNIDILYYQFF